MTTMTGTIVGGYIIDAVIGSGGMGQVFRATAADSGVRVALKRLHPHLVALPGFRSRFTREVEALAALNHPHIVRMLAAGTSDQDCFLVMELLEGGSLRGPLERRGRDEGALPLALGIELVRQAAEALAFAHSQGLIHRDIKPDNLLLAYDAAGGCQVKVGDFGLVQFAEHNQLTTGGAIVGTPAYLSPDQCQGLELDGRSDIYSLGVVLYELATGYLPFDVRTLSEAIFKHVYVPPTPPRQVRPDLPPELEAIILRCMAKQPDQRFATAGELAQALAAVAASLAPAQLLTPTEPAVADVDTEVDTDVPVPLMQITNDEGQALAESRLSGEGIVVGRAASCDVVLDEQSVAPRQMYVDWDGVEVRVVPLDASVPVLLGGVPLQLDTPHVWQPGSALRVGRLWLKMQVAHTDPALSPEPQEGSEAEETPSQPLPGEVAEQEQRSTHGASGALTVVDRIVVVLDNKELTLTPGQPAALRVTLANVSRIVEHLTIRVDGAPHEWVQASPPYVQLNPGGQATASLTITPPRSAESKADEYQVTVYAVSRDTPSEAGAAPCCWRVEPFYESEVSLKPGRAAGWRGASYTLKVTNSGNTPGRYTFVGEDEEQILTYGFAPERAVVDPGQTAKVNVSVGSEPMWLGSPANRAFKLRVKQERVKEPQELTAQLTVQPLIPGWLPKALMAAIVAVVLYGLAIVPPPLKSAPRVGFLLPPTKVVPTAAPRPTRPPKPTRTPKPTKTPKPTATVRPTKTPEPSPSPIPPTATVTPTATPIPPPMCRAGTPFPVTFQGPPRAEVLLLFDGRVVGSGVAGADGTGTMPLVVGDEQPGLHQITVETRQGGRVLHKLVCYVPPR
ncbi:MAG: hypothetical protein RLZZ387_4503 [Chloroflexota bacterium]|jgi:hypothetical protein